MILITGATGMVGGHLLLQLLTQGKQVKAIYREEAKIESLASGPLFKEAKHLLRLVTWYKADVRNITELEPVFEGVDEVYHCAALISFNPKDYRALRNINIDGTANVVNLCIAHRIKKLCYVSSIAALGQPNTNGITDETCFWNPEEDHDVYSITKYGAEMEVWRASQEGIPVVVVNPGVIFGGGIYSKSMEVFERVKKGFPYYTTGGSGFVGVEDVVKAMLFLMNSEVANERFVLVAENHTYKNLLTLVAEAMGKRPPHIEINKRVLNFLRLADFLKGMVTSGNRRITKQMVHSVTEVSTYSSAKLEALGFGFEPLQTSVERYATEFKQV